MLEQFLLLSSDWTGSRPGHLNSQELRPVGAALCHGTYQAVQQALDMFILTLFASLNHHIMCILKIYLSPSTHLLSHTNTCYATQSGMLIVYSPLSFRQHITVRNCYPSAINLKPSHS